MAHSRFTLPALTTSRMPLTESSSSSSSPLTPLSELSAATSVSRNSLITPTSTSDAKPPKSYITYPEGSFPLRPLTPPPKSRFVNLFETYSYAPQPTGPLSRSGSIGDTDNSPDSGPISLPASNSNPRHIPASLSFVSRGARIEPALRSAPLATSRTSSSWSSFSSISSHSPSVVSGSILESNPQIEQLHNIVLSLRYQLNEKSFALQTAEAEIARLAEAYSNILLDHNKSEEKHNSAQKRLDELEAQLSKREQGAHHKNVEKPPHMRQESKPRNNEMSKNRPNFRKAEIETTQPDDCLTDRAAPIELPDDEARLRVLIRIPEMPADIVVPRLADTFLSPDFNFEKWIATNGLQLPSSIKVLTPLTWTDRLKLDSAKMEGMGITNAEDRSYILRVFKSIAEGEAPGLHPSLIGGQFTEEQYVGIMREQRIDKHVPNLCGIPWPRRLFVEEEDLNLLCVQKAGARGTIMTVFSGLRRGGPRPDPRPRRGTKKSKRVKMEAENAEEGNAPEKPIHTKPADKKFTNNNKVPYGKQGTHRTILSRDKGGNAHGNSLHISGVSTNPSWFGNRV